MSIFLVNPYTFAAPSLSRVVFNTTYNATGGSSAVGTTFVTRDTLNTTETSGKSYSVFWQMQTTHGSATNDSRVQLVESATNRNAQNLEPQDTTDIFSHAGLYNYAGGTNKTFTLQTSGENNSTHTWKGFQTIALELDSLDLANSIVANTTTTTSYLPTAPLFANTTLVNGVEYYQISYAEGLSLGTSYPVFSTSYEYALSNSQMATYSKDTTNWVPYWKVEKLTANATPAALIVASNGTATVTARNIYITVLRKDKFPNSWFSTVTSYITTTAITFSNACSVTFTPNNPSNKHLILASTFLRTNSTTVSGRVKLVNTTDTVEYMTESTREAVNGTDDMPVSVARVVTFASGGSKTIEWQIASETTAVTTNVGISTIVVIDLGTT